MPRKLIEAEIAMLDRDGYVAPVRVFSDDQARRYRDRLEAYEASVADRPKEEVLFTLSRFKPHLLFTWLDEICRTEALLDAVEDLIGPDILVYSSAFFTKDARDPAYVPWHQDDVYSNMKGGPQVRAWVALTHSRPENGCMRVIPGSHRAGAFRHIERDDPDNILFRKERIVDAVDDSRAVDLILAPGEMSIHHMSTVHGSNPNTSDDRRIGFAVVYVPATVRPVGRNDSAMLVRGRDACGHWDLEAPPTADLDPAARAAHQRAMAIRSAYFFREMPETKAAP